jgi:hypothetical protein
MNSFRITAAIAMFAMTTACNTTKADADPVQQAGSGSVSLAGTSEQIPSYAPAVLREPPPADRATVDQRFDQAARAAWALIDRHYYAKTGLASASSSFPYPTTWDIASTLAAYYSARGLGLLSDTEYKRRAALLLATMKKARLHQGIAYGRNYDANTGELVGADQKPDENGTGYSAIDIGRLLVVLAIVAKQDADLADAARAVATRIDASRALKDGYLVGTERSKKTGEQNVYQEGRLGYEQYAANGFALWNMRPAGALDINANATRTTVLGIPITGDKRGLDRLTSEPFILHGLELGWDPGVRELAWQTLSAQAMRFAKTGELTMASEDAIDRAPYYFYYYCVYCSGKSFVINVHTPGIQLDAPRWLSTKAAFAWHALTPSKYTWQAIEAVKPALDPQKGWASGVYEGSGKSTATYSLNTAAVILEAALYRKTGKPLIAQAR